MWKPQCLYYWYSNLIWWNAPNASLCVSVLSCESMFGSRQHVKGKRAECSHCILAAFFIMITLSSPAHSSGLTASSAGCAWGPLSQAVNRWTETLGQLVGTAQHSWKSSVLIDSHSVSLSLLSLLTLSLSPASFRVKVFQIPDDIPAQRNNIQCQYYELHLGLWITVDFLFLDSTVELSDSVRGSKIPYSSGTTACVFCYWGSA